jgi:hypothetical protein
MKKLFNLVIAINLIILVFIPFATMIDMAPELNDNTSNDSYSTIED